MTKPKPINLRVTVDLRSRWVTVRDQGARSSCLACAASDAHMHAQDLDHPLSVEYLFCHAARFMPGRDVSSGLTFGAARSALSAHGQPREEEWPYQVVEPNPWTPPPVTRLWRADLQMASTNPVAEIVSAIRAQHAVILGIRLSVDFLVPPGPSFVISPTGPGFGGHAVLGVGLATDKRRVTYLLIRNSWGDAWGQAGYAWLPTKYLRDKLIGFCLASPLATN